MVVVTWGQHTEMFRSEYVPLVERERLAQEYLSLRKTMESLIEITKKFMDMALFSLSMHLSSRFRCCAI